MKNDISGLLISLVIVIVAVEILAFLLKKIKPANKRAGTLCSLIRSLLRYVGAVVILCLVLKFLGFDPKSIAASIGIVTLIIGFSAESLIADLVTGVFMIFENQYNVGDILEVQGFRGTVIDIGIRTTQLMDAGGNIKIINNSAMQNILNRSDRMSTAVVDLVIAIQNDFPSFEKKLPAMLADIQGKNAATFPKVPEYLGVQQVMSGSVKLRFTASVPENTIYQAQRVLNHELLIHFMAEGVKWTPSKIESEG